MTLLQNATAILLQNATKVYYKTHQLFYYKIRRSLESAPVLAVRAKVSETIHYRGYSFFTK